MGKKKKEILDKEYVPFSEGMKANGYSDGAIKTLWEILVPFSDYAFNKAHTAGYGLVSYWTAFLKANYPAEYMAALLTSVKDDKDKSAVYLNECRKMGIKVLPPDVNDSDFDFTPRGTDIRFGLSAIRNVGGNVVDSVIATRRRIGRFSDFHDFIAKVDASVCNKRVVESLIKSGAFDSLGHTRKGLVQIHEQVVDAAVDIKRAESHGQFDLFGGLEASGDERDGAARARSRSASGTRRSCWRTSGRCSACTCPTTRCTAPSACSRSSRTARSPRCSWTIASMPPSRPSAGSSPRCSARPPSKGRPGRSSRSRTSRAPSTSWCSRRPTTP